MKAVAEKEMRRIEGGAHSHSWRQYSHTTKSETYWDWNKFRFMPRVLHTIKYLCSGCSKRKTTTYYTYG